MTRKKIATDMTYEQLKWTVAYLLIIVCIHIGLVVLSINFDFEQGDFFAFSYGSAPIVMLIIGLISAYTFLPLIVNHGVTRKDYFIGGAISAVCVAVVLALVAIVVTLIEYGILNSLSINHDLQSMVGDMGGNWILAFIFYSVSILIVYYIGWFTGAGYYRYGWIKGFGFVAMAIVFMMVNDNLWEGDLFKGYATWLPIDLGELSIAISLIGSAILIIILLTLIRVITKKATIKM